tara:strand:+ start:358 stop:633 length:276 start_codon:yes stop_codon:yes gene_type:complete
MSNSQNKKLKIVGLYVLSIAMLYGYWYLDNSTELNDFLKKADRVRSDWGFGFYAIVGLIQYGFLIAGISIPLILTTLIIIKKRKNATQQRI